MLVCFCRQLDRENLGVIKRYQFKELLEVRFNIKISDEELKSVLRPLLEDSAHGLVPYAQFLELFTASRFIFFIHYNNYLLDLAGMMKYL